MRVKVLVNLGTNDFGDDALPEGEHEVTEAFGNLLIQKRLAVELIKAPTPKPKVEKYTPDKEA